MRLFRKRFGTSDQVEHFHTELRARRRRPGEDLQSLYNDICRLLSLAYPGPTTDLVNVVGRDAFLEALGDPALRVRSSDKVPATMEEALRIALNLEDLHWSKEAEMWAMERHMEPVEDEPKKRKEKYAKTLKVLQYFCGFHQQLARSRNGRTLKSSLQLTRIHRHERKHRLLLQSPQWLELSNCSGWRLSSSSARLTSPVMPGPLRGSSRGRKALKAHSAVTRSAWSFVLQAKHPSVVLHFDGYMSLVLGRNYTVLGHNYTVAHLVRCAGMRR